MNNKSGNKIKYNSSDVEATVTSRLSTKNSFLHSLALGRERRDRHGNPTYWGGKGTQMQGPGHKCGALSEQ
jgi:hypothetical protein